MGSRNRGHRHKRIQEIVQKEGWDKVNHSFPVGYDFKFENVSEVRRKKAEIKRLKEMGKP